MTSKFPSYLTSPRSSPPMMSRSSPATFRTNFKHQPVSTDAEAASGASKQMQHVHAFAAKLDADMKKAAET